MQTDEYRFHQGHLWCQPAAKGEVRIGISDFAQNSLGEIVYFELPEVGDEIVEGEPMGTVESVKVVNDLIAPISGTVSAINTELASTPSLGNEEPYTEGWLLRVDPSDAGSMETLMTEAAYSSFIDD